jgi:hypothetical protein
MWVKRDGWRLIKAKYAGNVGKKVPEYNWLQSSLN